MLSPALFYRRRPLASVLLVALAIIAALLTARAVFHQSRPNYLTAPVTRGTLEETVLATGIVQPSRQVSVGAQVSGQIKSLKVTLGERVHRGQLLAEIDPVLQQNELRRAEAALRDVRAQRSAKLALLRQYELEAGRETYMLQRDASSRADYEVARANEAATRAGVASLEAQIVVAQVAVDSARANVGYTRITAPMDGEIIALVAQEGQTVVSAQIAPVILILAKLDEMTVRARISEADVVRVKPGLPVYFTILGAPDKRYESRLRAVEPAPESIASESMQQLYRAQSNTPTAVYYNGLFDVPNADGELRTSMTAQVSIVLGRATHTLLVPMAALGKPLGDGRYEIRVLAGGKLQTRRVQLGLTNDVDAQVLSGLSERENVIIGDALATPADASSDARGQ
jgi:macrolide-specific efflux system membrane fusion protein